jgi:hypothetical protein
MAVVYPSLLVFVHNYTVFFLQQYLLYAPRSRIYAIPRPASRTIVLSLWYVWHFDAPREGYKLSCPNRPGSWLF